MSVFSFQSTISSMGRLHFVDVDKGILILIVVAHHVFQVMRNNGIIPTESVYIERFYATFFMPAFFFVTGYCSNFNKPFKQFLMSNIKSLIVPSLVFFFLNRSAEMLYFQTFSCRNVLFAIKLFLLTGGTWFLTALFWAKIIYWWLRKYNKWAVWGGQVFLLVFTSLVCARLFEPWYVYHSFGLLIFIWLVELMKGRVPNLFLFLLLLIFYIAYVAIIVYDGQHYPRISMQISLRINSILPFITGAISGTLVLFYISYLIKQNSILEYIGRNSIVIYLTHFVVIEILVDISQKIEAPVIIGNCFLFILVFCVTLIITTALVPILNSKYSRWMIGRY